MITAVALKKMKEAGRRIVALTAYDYLAARLLDEAGVDLILVGDSLGMVFFGRPSTLTVTVEEVIHHTRAVRGGVRNALVVADMPFMSYQSGRRDALRNAGRLVKEGGAQAVKLEGGREVARTARALVEAGIPVIGHLGLTPQSTNKFGGYRLQGTTPAGAARIVADAEVLVAAGVSAIVLELVPQQLAEYLTALCVVPTIGIGAGAGCDGQILVLPDMLGMYWPVLGVKAPRLVKEYAQLASATRRAVTNYRDEVRRGKFPARRHSFRLPGDKWREIGDAVRRRKS